MLRTITFYVGIVLILTCFYIAVYGNSIKAQVQASNVTTRDSLISLGNTLVEYGQKNAGFADTTLQSNRTIRTADFDTYLQHLLTKTYSITEPCTIQLISENGATSTLDWDPSVSKVISWKHSASTNLLTKRLNRGDKFSIIITPTYIHTDTLTITSTYEGYSLQFDGVAEGYIKKIGE